MIKNNEIIKRQIIETGFIGNEYLADVEKMPPRLRIDIRYENGGIEFENLPETNCLNIRVVPSGLELFAEDIGLDGFLPDVGTILNPKVGVQYELLDLIRLEKPPQWIFGEGELTLFNTLPFTKRYRTVTGCEIEVLLLQNGYVRVDVLSKKTEDLYKKVGFISSMETESGLDVVVGPDIEKIKSRVFMAETDIPTVDPGLFDALKRYAFIGPLDVRNDLYYGWCIFGQSDKYKRFVDSTRIKGIDCYYYNLELFCDLDEPF